MVNNLIAWKRFRLWRSRPTCWPLWLALLVGAPLVLAGCHRQTGPARTAITAAAGPRFADVGTAAGLHYQWVVAGPRPLNILQTIGNGCAFLDYNNDGNLDILLVGPKLALYRGDGHGHFTDVTHETGLDRHSDHFLGCAVGDYDNDGYADIYISAYRGGMLLHNEAGKRFKDVTAQSGIRPQPWGTTCAFGDYNDDGRLDLYIGNYAVFGPDQMQLCKDHGLLTSCGPRNYKPIKGVLYRGDGHGHFVDVTHEAGADSVVGRTLGVAFADFDGSGLQGLAIENDEAPGDLLQPYRKGSTVAYKDVGETSGTAYDRDGNVHGGMGADWGDIDNDGRPDLFVGTFQDETKCIYHNDGGGSFTDVGIPSGAFVTTAPNVTFGCKFFDYDNDGWLDLVIANGHVQDNIHAIDPKTTYRQTVQLLHNLGTAPVHFKDVSSQAGPTFREPIVGRGLASGDYDNDGRVDLLVVDSEGKPLLLHNESAGGHWLGIKLIGTTSNRDGYGAELTVRFGSRKLVAQCQSDGSYMSASDPRVHFGLGKAARLDTLTIRWPSGKTDVLHDLAADRYITVREGTGIAGREIAALPRES